MSIPIMRLRDGATLPVKPSGDMLKGWLPGTLVNYVQGKDGHYLTVDLASNMRDKKGCGGFTVNGSYSLRNNFDFRFANDNQKNGIWTSDQNVYLSKSEQNFDFQVDSSKKTFIQGKDLTTINFDGGVFRIYTYQKYDNEYIQSNGQKGGVIDWQSHIGQLFGCSCRSLFTTLQNNVLDQPYEYRIGGVYEDQNGKKYIVGVKR